MKPSHKELYPTCSVASSASSEAEDADNHKFGGAEGFQPNYCPGSAAPDYTDLCVGGAAGYTVSLTRANTNEHRS